MRKNLTVIFTVGALVLSGCGGDSSSPVVPANTGSGNTGGGGGGASSLSINPATATVGVGGSVSFSASGGSGSYTYSTSSGSMSSGVLTATSTGTATVTVNDGTTTVTATVHIKGPSIMTLSGDTSCFALPGNDYQCFGYDPVPLYNTSVGVDNGHDLPIEIDPAIFISGLSGLASAPKGFAPESTCFKGGINSNVYCYGNNQNGALGQSNAVNSSVPLMVPGLPAVAKVVRGNDHVCVLTVGGKVYCWGNNDYNQLGVTTPAFNCDSALSSCATSPQGVLTTPGGVVDVAAGYNTTCAVMLDGTVKCWGQDNLGQCGVGSTASTRTVPTTVSTIAGGATAVTVSMSGKGACAVVSGGLKCWGGVAAPLSDALGTGLGASSTPSFINNMGAGSFVTQVSSGLGHICAIQSGAVKCFGFNSEGELGNGSTIDSSVPVVVSGLFGISNISLGKDHACATNAGRVTYCWGRNDRGQLGRGDNTNSDVPVLVSQWK